MKLKFLGAVGCVTGSCSLLEDSSGKTRFLVDCGMTQGENDEAVLNSLPWPFVPARLSFVLLTHAHLDHCGLLGRLVREGFVGPVFCTRFTAELAKINLLDAARLSSDLFTELDVRRINFVAVDDRPMFEFGRYFEVVEGLEVAFHPSAHIGGACSIGVRWLVSAKNSREIVFSGDLGPNTSVNAPQPLLAPRQFLATTPDYMVVESTYGSRVRDAVFSSSSARMADLEGIISEAMQRVPGDEEPGGACLVIPCFSIHRAQELLVDLYALFEVRLRDRLLAIRPAFQEPSYIENALKEGIRSSRILSPQSILERSPVSDRQRFHELFKRQKLASPDSTERDVFFLAEASEEQKEEARQILRRMVRPSRKLAIRVFLDSPMSHRVTAVYQRQLCERSPGDLEHRIYRNPALKEYFSARNEAEVDSILGKLLSGKIEKDSPSVERKFLTYSLTFCNPENSVELIAAAQSSALSIVLSSSGMGDVGPITMHLERELTNPRSLVMLTGYAPPSSVAGRLRLFSKTGSTGSSGILQLASVGLPDSDIRATIRDMGPYYSGHADQAGLLDFVFLSAGSAPPGESAMTVFANHGTDEVRNVFRKAIMARTAEKRDGDRVVKGVEVPGRDRRWFDLDDGLWLQHVPETAEETREQQLIRLYLEQRRTNDLLAELIRVNRSLVRTLVSGPTRTRGRG